MKKSVIDHYTYAYLANEVYVEGGGKPPSGWEIYDAYYPHGKEGLGICAYINHVNKAIIISIRGSNNNEDWKNNFGFTLFNLEPDNIRYIQEFINKLREDIKSKIELEKKEKKFHIAKALFKDMAIGLEKTVSIYEQFDKSLSSDQRLHIADVYLKYLSEYYKNSNWTQTTISFISSFLFGHYFHRLFKGSFFYFLDLIIADEETRTELLKASGIDDPNTLKFFSDQLTEIQPYLKIELNETAQALSEFEKQYPDYNVYLTGHSAGALMAEVCASELLIPAVTFESPGSFTIARKVRNFNETTANKIITGYLSAPNLINTVGIHLGTRYRLYIPHIDSVLTESLGYKLKYFGKSLLDTTKRVAIPFLFFSPPTAGITLLTASATTGILSIWENKEWLARQHNMTNILCCFDEKTGSPHNVSKIISWPSSFDQIKSKAWDVLTDFVPLRSSNYGLHSYFLSDENNIIESMIENLYGYNVSRIEGSLSVNKDQVQPKEEIPLQTNAKQTQVAQSNEAFCEGETCTNPQPSQHRVFETQNNAGLPISNHQTNDRFPENQLKVINSILFTSDATRSVAIPWFSPVIAFSVLDRGYQSIRKIFSSDSKNGTLEEVVTQSIPQDLSNQEREAMGSAIELQKALSVHLTSAVKNLFSVPDTTLTEHASAINSHSGENPMPEQQLIQHINCTSSFSEKLIVGQYIAHYTRKYSPFTLPWNRKHALSSSERANLESYQKQIQNFEKIIASQKTSRTGQTSLFDDKFSFVDKKLIELKHDIRKALNGHQITDTIFSDILNKINRVEEIIHEIAKQNKILKRFEIKEKRLERRNKHMGCQSAAITHYNHVSGKLTHEIIRTLPNFDKTAEFDIAVSAQQPTLPLSAIQQFWEQPNLVSHPDQKLANENNTTSRCVLSRR